MLSKWSFRNQMKTNRFLFLFGKLVWKFRLQIFDHVSYLYNLCRPLILAWSSLYLGHAGHCTHHNIREDFKTLVSSKWKIVIPWTKNVIFWCTVSLQGSIMKAATALPVVINSTNICALRICYETTVCCVYYIMFGLFNFICDVSRFFMCVQQIIFFWSSVNNLFR